MREWRPGSPQLRLMGFRQPDGHVELICCPAVVPGCGPSKRGQTSILRRRAPCQRGLEGSSLVGEGPDLQGVSLRVPLAEWPAWSPAASGVLGVGCGKFPVPPGVSSLPAARVEAVPGLRGLWRGPGQGVGVLHPRILLGLLLTRSAVPMEVLSQKRSRVSHALNRICSTDFATAAKADETAEHVQGRAYVGMHGWIPRQAMYELCVIRCLGPISLVTTAFLAEKFLRGQGHASFAVIPM